MIIRDASCQVTSIGFINTYSSLYDHCIWLLELKGYLVDACNVVASYDRPLTTIIKYKGISI
jgi:hypothetical protein